MDNYSNICQRYKMRGRKKSLWPKILIATSIIAIIVSVFIYFAINHMSSFKTGDMYTYYTDFTKGEINIVMDDKTIPLEHFPYFQNKELYIPADYIKNYLDEYIFWDNEAKKLTITTENKVIRMKTEDLTYYVNGKKMELDMPVYEKDGIAFMPKSMVEKLYNVTINYYDETSIASIDKNEITRTKAEVIKETMLRYEDSKKSPKVAKMSLSDIVYVYTPGEIDKSYIRVRDSVGRIGYIQNKYLGKQTQVKGVPINEQPILAAEPPIDSKIVLLWDQSFAKTVGTPIPKNVNVLSPTWFSFGSNALNGDIVNNGADIKYVDWAHDNNVQVWALITDNFNSEVSHAVLTNTDTREYVIKQLLAFTSMYNLDGINIDFEAVKKADGEYYVQFLRELKPLLAEQGVYLSVDLFVPTYTKHYNRTEVAKTVDYVCVMAYDEHYSGSETSGPVASIGFVDDGIKTTLDEVPSNQVLMGLPFYVRIWREVEGENGKVSFKIDNVSMESALKIFKKNNADFIKLDDIGYTYAEYYAKEDGENVRYRVWLEDEESISLKLDIFKKYDLGGVACWKKGLEKPGVWDRISSYLVQH